ncbi:MAG: trehalose-6-phosphate synthase [Salinarimonadaceae bacterium]|nr:MAG: trehalose-6-phosphate synthase [Salinarimonadaceae bacterium]
MLIWPVATGFVEDWARRDVEMRSRLVYSAARDPIETLREAGDEAGLTRLMERIGQDDGVVAVALCENGVVRAGSPAMPAEFRCSHTPANGSSLSIVTFEDARLLVSAYSLGEGSDQVTLVVMHDDQEIEARLSRARLFIILAAIGIAFGGAALASLFAYLVMRRWTISVRQAIEDARAGRPEESGGASTMIGEEIRKTLAELDFVRHSIDAAHTEWSPETLRLALANELPGSEVIVVSNREPYIHNRLEDGTIQLQRPASGLVSALEPVTRACGGVWIAHGSGTADRDTVDSDDRVMVPPSNPSYALRRLWLTEEEQEGYYYGFANEGLWPLCHIAFVRPVFRESDWRMYREVNRRFAEAVAAEARRPDPIVLIQDYHLALAPRMIRERLPEATIVTFWHIPWPNSETFGICPYKEDIIDGLLGSSILGFHTQFHCNNFIETVDRFVESRIDREEASITLRGHETFVRPYPISIEWPPAAMANQKPVEEARVAVRERLGLPEDVRLGVGIERFDYTKGILDRMRAVDALLTTHPEWRERFCFLQAAAPTRSKLSNYRTLQEEAEALAQDINARHGGPFPVIQLVARHHDPEEVFELFRAGDLCIVSSLHDGMNLVAKEFVAARDDERGVLILSAFAGASRELNEALIVNPYDAYAMGEAIARALEMDEAEQRERMHTMRQQVQSRNVYRWAGQMLLDAAHLRKKQRIMRLMDKAGQA